MRKNRNRPRSRFRRGIGFTAFAVAAAIAAAPSASADPARKPARSYPAAPMPSPVTEPELPSGDQWRTGVNAAFAAYETALEQKDMRGLERVWVFFPGSIYRVRWESKFRRPEPLDISIDIRSMEKDANDQVIVHFDQKEASPARTRTYAYKAVLMERKSTGEWQMIENRLQKR